MTRPLALLTEDQTKECRVTADEAGFGSLRTEQGHLPLRAMDVQTRIDGLFAQVKVRQEFVNTFTVPLEATYIFPLPDRSSVTRFHVEVAGRVIEGVLKERGAARREYDQAIQAGQRAAITEEDRPGVFNLRIGNLMPGEKAVVQLTLVGPLLFSDGEATFRFPLVVAPRYIPGTPLPGPSVGGGVEPDTDAVPDASRISPPVLLPGFPSPVRLSLAVDVHPAGLTVGGFASSLHAVVSETADDGSQRIRIQPGERLDRDFILRFRVGSDRVQTALSLTPDADGKQGTFLLTLLPPASAQRQQRPRDVVFILDRSGSMAGWKMVAARRALARMVDTLTDADRFTVYAFDDRVDTPPAFAGVGLLPASDRNRFRAVEFLAGIDSRGGTELAAPLDLAVNQLAGNDAAHDRILILVTDGQVGNEDQLLQLLGPRIQNLRIFTLGIDQAVNEGFLKRLALLGGGACEIVESEDRLDTVMDRVHRRIATAVISQVAVKPSGLRFDAQSLVPARLPDLFAGAPVFILGRYQRLVEDTATVAVEGRDAAGRPWSQTLTGKNGDSTALPSIWARGRIRDLEDRYATGAADRGDLERQIVELSLRHNVLSRFTAYVAVDRSEIVNAGGQLHQMTQPVEEAAGWEMLKKLSTAAQPATMLALRSFSGGGGAARKANMAQDRKEADADELFCAAVQEQAETMTGAPPAPPQACSAAVPPQTGQFKSKAEEEHAASHYTSGNIQILRDCEHIRERPSMYIGDTGPGGLHHLVCELVSNSLNEAMAGHGKCIQVNIHQDGSISVSDDGRGIPVDMHNGMSTLQAVMTIMGAGTGLEFNYKTSGGLHGIGVKAVTALSEWTRAEVRRDGKLYQQTYERGKATSDVATIGTATDTGTKITFLPDSGIFSIVSFDFALLQNRLRELAFLNRSVTFKLCDERTGMEETFHFPREVRDDLAAFRMRVRELLDRCRRPESGDLLTRLGILAEQLAALIDDLRSVGIAESRYQPLVQLLADLRQALPVGNNLDQLWSRSEAILQAFSDGSAPAGRRESFWKFWK